jgi:hypothetical protein
MYEDLAPLANPVRAPGQRVTMPKIICIWADDERDLSRAVSVPVTVEITRVFGRVDLHLRTAFHLSGHATQYKRAPCWSRF